MRNKIGLFFLNQIQEIFEDRGLRIYGAFLTLTIALSIFAMYPVNEYGYHISWPGVPQWMEVHQANFWNIYFIAWGLITLLTFLGFIKSKKIAYWGLWLSLLMKGFLSIQNYRYMGNYHYIPTLLILVYLCCLQKRQLLPVLIVSIYLAAGFLKLNLEWFAGQALLIPAPWFLQPFGNLIYSFVVFLELGMSLYLLSKNASLRIFIFSTFILFHLLSWHWVGYFYPCIMFLVLTFFPIMWMEKTGPVLFKGFSFFNKKNLALIFLFWFFQLIPKLQPIDSSISGDGRLWGLNMYDAQAECMEVSILKKGNEYVEISSSIRLEAVRIRCDPIVYLDKIKKACKEIKDSGDIANIDFFLQTKRRTDVDFKIIVHIKDACSKELKYNLLGWNQWREN